MPYVHLPHRLRHACAFVSAAAVVVSVGAWASAAPPSAAAGGVSEQAFDRVIVQAQSVAYARSAVEAAGGEVRIELPIVDGVAADVPASRVAALTAVSGIRAVTPDARMTVQGSVGSSGPTSAGAPVFSRLPISVYPEVVRADELAAEGGTGEGITVALLDTGINETHDLAGRIKPVRQRLFQREQPCVNLSGEPTCADDYGHGTFLAGIIAGNGAALGGKYAGIAPEADLISIKVGARDGSADVSNVLAGIQWAVSFKDTYDISVLNLSLGTDSTQSWTVDPLNYAVEQAWKAGITVVVAASNRGPDAGTISKPGDDPYVITVGATDDRFTVPLEDDVLPDFSSRGPAPEGVAKPDVVAPGAHIVSLRALGSAIDEKFPKGVDRTYRQGSGTSMSTAVVSGVVAAILSRDPNLQPDRLKFMLMDTARPVAVDDHDAVGEGMVDAYAAAFEAAPGEANQDLASSSGSGGLDLSRGSVIVMLDDADHTILQDPLLTAQLRIWDLVRFLELPWTELEWYLSGLGQLPWYATSWYGHNWEGHNWEDCSGGQPGEEECWYGHNWEGSAWYGAWD